MVKLSQEAAPRQPPPGTVIDGRYRVLRCIGQGGAGLVHEVEHVRTGRRLAMKTLLDEAGYARLEQEARATSVMKNPHAVRITDMGLGAGGNASAYVVMELLEGQSLRALIDEAGPLSVDATVNIALQVCECLAEAHGHGIIHRDLKPENVFLTQSPWPGQHDVKVLDFGVVKISGEGSIPHTSLTRTGSTVGTPYYMSLEQLRNSSAVDARADIYSLGVVLYECLAGRKPFEADTIGDLVYAICSGPPADLRELRPDVPAEVCALVMRALSVPKEDRPASMRDLAAALLPFGNPAFGLWLGGGAPARPASAAPPRPGASRVGAPRPAAGVPARPGKTQPLVEPPSPALPQRKEPSSAAFARPMLDDERSGSRDTPTEMYQKGQEPTPDEPPGRGAGDVEDGERTSIPTLELDDNRKKPVAPTPHGAFNALTPATTVTAVLQTDADAMDDWKATAKIPTSLAAPPGAAPPGAASPGAQPYLYPGMPPPGPASAPRASLSPPPLRPPWQQSLDRALVGVGGALERAGKSAAQRYREASPVERLALAVGGASLLAAVLVLFLYLLLS